MKVVCPLCGNVNLIVAGIRGVKVMGGEIRFKCDICGEIIGIGLIPTKDNTIEFEVFDNLSNYIG